MVNPDSYGLGDQACDCQIMQMHGSTDKAL